MYNNAIRSGFHAALTLTVIAFGAIEVGATPLPLDRSAANPTAAEGQRPWRSVEDGIGVGKLMNARDGSLKSAALARFVQFRLSPRYSAARPRLADIGVLNATPASRPIADVYDSAGIGSGMRGRITPREMAPRQRPTQMTRRLGSVHSGSGSASGTGTVEVVPSQRPEAPIREPERREQSNNALDLGIKTLDYVLLATRIIVENVSWFLQSFI